MKTIKITPRGYCHGVVNAINTITELASRSNTKPITILGMVIHNKQVIDYFTKKGIRTLHDPSKSRLELLDQIDEGIVVFTAHGVSPQVREKAQQKGLEIIDTTCKDVTKSYELIQNLLKEEYKVIYIGKHGHPESEGALGLGSNVFVIETILELENLKLSGDKIALTNQTTMSLYDIYNLVEKAKSIYPNLYFVDEVCNATRIRQEAVINANKEIDHIFVVGDRLSNNTKQLAYTSINQAHINANVIENVSQLDIEQLKNYTCVGVTSGASTPTQVTNEVIAFLEQFDYNNPRTHNVQSKLKVDTLLDRKTLT
jgi:4-hydroxy-3-methylbut-2-enyl diphosphate reductase